MEAQQFGVATQCLLHNQKDCQCYNNGIGKLVQKHHNGNKRNHFLFFVLSLVLVSKP